MSAVATIPPPTLPMQEQLSLDLSHVKEVMVNTPKQSLSYFNAESHIAANDSLLAESSFVMGVETEDTPLGQSQEITLEQADALFLNNSGYVLFALHALYIAAKDIADADRENPSRKALRFRDSALAWISQESEDDELEAAHQLNELGIEDGENENHAFFPFSDCVKLLDYELRFQSMNDVSLPDIANNPDVIANWIKNDPKEAARYLRGYRLLFSDEESETAKTQTYNNIVAQRG